MADVILRMDNGHGETCVPDIFIDEYMPAADGEFVKVYLYLLRCMKDPEKTFSVADTAASFGCSAGRVIDALKFWEHAGLLRLDFDSRGELSCVCFTRRLTSYTPIPAAKAAPALSRDADAIYSVRDRDAVKPENRQEKADASNISNADRRELLMIAETYLGRTLNSSEVDKLYDWIDRLKLPAEVIDYLIDYCVTHDHTAFSYMDKIAVSWAGEGIDTLSKAKDRTRDFDSSGTYDTVRKAFGISGRSLVESEKNYIRFWAMDLSMSDDLISLACERTVLKTSRASFEYADRILHSWHDNHVSSTADVTALDEKYRAQKTSQPKAVSGASKPGGTQFSSFENRDYNQSTIDDIERALLKV
ncbi:MAG: DnaD domain protein [Lachnospiraceae bacterium]|nr:DnaD domain protein [Lachnospiraceae bacterium]